MELKLQMSKNALCPCHSGEKYKACCMGSLTKEQEEYYAFLNKQKIIKNKLISWILSHLRADEIDDYAYSFDKKPFRDYEGSEEKISFFDWLLLEAKKDGKSFIQYVLGESPEGFDALEKEILKEWENNTSGGIFEVLEAFPDDWKLSLQEVFTHKEYEVVDRIASNHFIRGDIIYSRLQRIFLKYYLSGVGKAIPRNQLRQLKDFVETKLSETKKENPQISYWEFMGQFGKDINEFEPVKPSFINSKGDDLCFSEITYKFDIKDIGPILDSFSDEKKYIISDMDFPKGGFRSAEIAIIAEKEENSPKQNTVSMTKYLMSPDGDIITTQGSITIKKDKLKIFTNSKEAAETIKKIIEKSGYFELEKESYQTAGDCLKEINDDEEPAARRKSKKEIGAEKIFFEAYYKDWCDQKIPALGNITPRQAMKTPDGKKLFKNLLLDFENQEEHKKKDGEKFVSAVEIIRKELDFYEN